jgi:hypothetical protein
LGDQIKPTWLQFSHDDDHLPEPFMEQKNFFVRGFVRLMLLADGLIFEHPGKPN